MADDQATLGSFAGSDSDDGDAGDGAETGNTASSDNESGTEEAGETAERAEEAVERGIDRNPAGDPVCPWCLAPAEAFVDQGLTGRACGRCSAALPNGADWFRERDVVARRPMYDVDGAGE